MRFEFDAPITGFFRAQSDDAKALSLAQVLRAGQISFNSGTDAARYTAQSYTLTHFLIFAQSGKYRPLYAEFLRSSYLGNGGSSNFFKVIGVDEKTLESEWKAYVKSLAGG